MMFRFAYPAVLLLLFVVAGWMVFLLRRNLPGITYSMTSSMVALGGIQGRFLPKYTVFLRCLCLILLVLAGARPQLYNVSRDIRSSGVDIMLALDTSGSMQALDFKLDEEPVTRLTAVKKVVTDFIQKREHDRLGLVVFGEEAFTQAPLTLDKGLLLELIKDMKVGMAGDRTAVGSAIAIASKRLKGVKAKSKILILLTDGRSNAGQITPQAAAEAARALGIKIYSIGVGGMGPAPFRIKTFLGTRIVHQNVDLDEKTLKKIARMGGGAYFRAADSDQLSEIYDLIDREEKTEAKVKTFFHFRELYTYLLIPALILFGIEILLKTWILRVIP
ncbi:MAG: VWA domain-containing protein [Thermodesulfobacteriota bacterium]